MKLLELGLLYGLVGTGCALWVVLRAEQQSGRWADALVLLVLWPLYGPFVLSRWVGEDDPSRQEGAFLGALRRAQGTPLASLLPDETAARALGRRLRVAAGKVAELDRLLGSPDFSESVARSQRRQLAERGASAYALSAAAMRIQNIQRLGRLRSRFARELDEVGELLAQLRTQAEVVRLAGAPDTGARELVEELVSRVEGLDRMLDDDPCPWELSAPGEAADPAPDLPVGSGDTTGCRSTPDPVEQEPGYAENPGRR